MKEKAQKENRRVIEIKDLDPKQRGELMHLCLLGVYPTIRWNFKWDKYVVLSIPDGITEEFVYEFKTVRYKFLSLFEKPVALTQADLYGYFFKRKNKRVQIYICEDNEIQTFDEPVDTENAEETLHKFKQVEEGKLPKPPKSLKCRKCEFANICPLISKSSREM